MPRKVSGLHSLHVQIPSEQWEDLKLYCNSGYERIRATHIVNELLSTFITEVVQPALNNGEDANMKRIRAGIEYTLKHQNLL